MNLEEMRDELSLIVQDESYDDKLDGYINQAVAFVAGQVLIPSHKRISTVDTIADQAYISLTGLTGGFSGSLRRVFNAGGDEMASYPSLELLMDDYPTMVEAGDVESVALEGFTLWYQKIPAAPETLTVLYRINPATLSENSDVPSDFPSHLHMNLFVHGGAYMIWNMKEDDDDTEKVNSNSHYYLSFDENNKKSGVVKFREWIGMRRRHYISSSWSE